MVRCRLLVYIAFIGNFVLPVLAEPREPCRVNTDWKLIPDSWDCSVYYTCSYGELTRLECEQGQSFNRHMCFPIYSENDLCNKPKTRRLSARTFQFSGYRTTCLPGETGIYPHPFRCAQYFNCSASNPTSGIIKRPFLDECPFLYLFDEQHLVCRPESVVNCGSLRSRPQTECDYMKNQCLTSHGIPCSVRLPTCKGLQDGPNAWPDRVSSPYYVECSNGEVLAKKTCGSMEDSLGISKQATFNENLRKCTVAQS